MRFRNREEAARLLAERLEPYRDRHPLVLGIPRGGVPMARIVAEHLHADLDVALVHKLRAPFQPELALGSIDDLGHVIDERERYALVRIHRLDQLAQIAVVDQLALIDHDDARAQRDDIVHVV